MTNEKEQDYPALLIQLFYQFAHDVSMVTLMRAVAVRRILCLSARTKESGSISFNGELQRLKLRSNMGLVAKGLI